MCCCPAACSQFILQNGCNIIWTVIGCLIGCCTGTVSGIMSLWSRRPRSSNSRRHRRTNQRRRRRQSFSDLLPNPRSGRRLQIEDVTESQEMELRTPGTPTGVHTGVPAIRRIQKKPTWTIDNVEITQPRKALTAAYKRIRAITNKTSVTDFQVQLSGQPAGAIVDTGADCSCEGEKWVECHNCAHLIKETNKIITSRRKGANNGEDNCYFNGCQTLARAAATTPPPPPPPTTTTMTQRLKKMPTNLQRTPTSLKRTPLHCSY